MMPYFILNVKLFALLLRKKKGRGGMQQFDGNICLCDTFQLNFIFFACKAVKFWRIFFNLFAPSGSKLDILKKFVISEV